MSCNEWAAGDIILPSSAFSPFRKAVQEAMHDKWKRAFDASQSFWKSLTPRERSDFELFRKALYSRHFDWDTQWLIDPQRLRDVRPKRVLQSDVDWPTNRTVDFHEGDLRLHFKRETRTLTFDVPEGNRSVDHAKETRLYEVFVDQMRKVRWTHGTGGVILGNDEYNEEGGRNYEGGGGSYVVDAFGYIGAKEAPAHVGEFLNGKGQRVHVETKYGRTGRVTGKVVSGPAPRPTFTRLYG